MTLKEMRELLGISRAEFSRRYGIPIRTLESWETETGNRRSAPEWAMRLLERVVKEDAWVQLKMRVEAYINSLRDAHGDAIVTDPIYAGDMATFILQPDDPVQGTIFQVRADGTVRNCGLGEGCFWTEWREGFALAGDDVDELDLMTTTCGNPPV